MKIMFFEFLTCTSIFLMNDNKCNNKSEVTKNVALKSRCCQTALHMSFKSHYWTSDCICTIDLTLKLAASASLIESV